MSSERAISTNNLLMGSLTLAVSILIALIGFLGKEALRKLDANNTSVIQMQSAQQEMAKRLDSVDSRTAAMEQRLVDVVPRGVINTEIENLKSKIVELQLLTGQILRQTPRKVKSEHDNGDG